MTDVSEAQDGAEVIPGDPDRIEELAGRLRRFGVGMSDAAMVLGEIGSGAWSGDGAKAFRDQLDLQPARYLSGSEAFGVVSAALFRYAEELRAAQRQAGQAIGRYAAGQAVSARWHASGEDVPLAPDEDRMHPPPGARPDPVDPGEPDRDEARSMVASAQHRVQVAADALVPVLRKASESAPKKPSRWKSWLTLGLDPHAGATLSHVYVSIAKGIGDAVTGMGRGAWALTGAAIQNPHEFLGAWKGVGLYLQGDPASRQAVAQDLIDWDEWSEDPARAFGHAAMNVGTLFIGGTAASKVGLLSKGGEVAGIDGAKLARIAQLRAAAEATAEHPVEVGGFPAYRGLPESARYSQKNYGEIFGASGSFPATKVQRIALLLKHGRLKPTDVPVDIIRRDGRILVMNTRSSHALAEAGIPRSQWIVRDVTGDANFEKTLTRRLKKNRLGPDGIDEIPRTKSRPKPGLPRAKELDEPPPRVHLPARLTAAGQSGLIVPLTARRGGSHAHPTYQ